MLVSHTLRCESLPTYLIFRLLSLTVFQMLGKHLNQSEPYMQSLGMTKSKMLFFNLQGHIASPWQEHPSIDLRV